MTCDFYYIKVSLEFQCDAIELSGNLGGPYLGMQVLGGPIAQRLQSTLAALPRIGTIQTPHPPTHPGNVLLSTYPSLEDVSRLGCLTYLKDLKDDS